MSISSQEHILDLQNIFLSDVKEKKIGTSLNDFLAKENFWIFGVPNPDLVGYEFILIYILATHPELFVKQLT